MKLNRWLRLCLLVFCICAVTGYIYGQEGTTLTIVHSSDGESALTANDYSGSVAQFATVVKSVVDEVGKNNVLVVSAGDNFLAGIEYAASEGVYDARALSQIGFDVSAIGNHEFDFGPAGLKNFVTNARFIFVSSNLDFSDDPDLRRFVNRRIFNHRTIKKAGQEIGLVGATTEEISYISSPGPNIKINAVQESLQSAVDMLRDRGVKIIIALTHLQNIEEEKRLAREIDGVDVFIAGGGDDLIGNDNNSYLVRKDRSGNDVTDKPTGPYPFRTTSAGGEPVVVVSTDGSYNYVGRLDITFDNEGVITSVSETSGPIPVSTAVKADARIQRGIVDAVERTIEGFATEVVGKTIDGLDGTREVVRTQESTMGNAITDGYLYSIKQSNVGNADFAFTNGGGIRRSVVVPKGENVNKQQVLTALPFSNYLTIVEDMTASEIKALFEHSVAELPEAAGRFLQVSGVSVVYDSTKAPGSRVLSVTIGGDEVVSDGKAVSNNTYNGVTNSFLAGGGDGYQVLANIPKSRKVGSGYSYAQGFEIYLEKESPIASPISNRLVDSGQ